MAILNINLTNMKSLSLSCNKSVECGSSLSPTTTVKNPVKKGKISKQLQAIKTKQK